ncbi:4062_t:CDS:2, partial [Acaulospora colombiana]
ARDEFNAIYSPYKPQEETIPSEGISMVDKPECNDKDLIDDGELSSLAELSFQLALIPTWAVAAKSRAAMLLPSFLQ